MEVAGGRWGKRGRKCSSYAEGASRTRKGTTAGHGGDETLPADMAAAHPRTEPYGTAIASEGLQAENWKVLIVWERAVRKLRTTHLIGLSTEQSSHFV